MKIVSFNIRCVGDPNGNSVKERAERLKTVLDKYDAELIGFQESTPEWYEFIKRDYGEKYEMFNRYRDTDHLESAPILWNKERFSCIDKGYFGFRKPRIFSLTGGMSWNISEFVFGQGCLTEKTEKFLIFWTRITASETTAN